tara:strand:- start:3153 stop:3998 length:846 start_codon:yes stop_codon:yes gene_type:complete
MKKIKPHFVYNKKQRNGVFYFLLAVLILQGAYFYVSNSAKLLIDDDVELQQLRSQLDSLKQLKSIDFKVYKFNPNFISDRKGYSLGMSVKEIDRLHAYRSENKWIQNRIHFQEVTQISDSLLELLAPLFLFPKKRKIAKPKKYPKKNIVKTDINLASAEDLKNIYGIGEKLSLRIVKYRNKIQGYTYMSQLSEVWGLSKEVIAELNSKYMIENKPKIERINFNKASFKEVLSIVYLDYETTKLLFNYKDSVGEIQNLLEIKKIQGFPIDKYDRIALYLQIE